MNARTSTRIKFVSLTLAAMALVALSLVQVSAGTYGKDRMMHKGARDAASTHVLRLGAAGYSPVSYLDSGRAEPGNPRFAAEHEGVTYFFTSAKQRATFLADPERYVPAYGGYCAYGCAVVGKFIPDPTNFKIVNGRIFLFLRNDDIDTLKLWNDGSERDLTMKADKYWATQTQSKAYIGARNVPASGIALDGYSPVSYFIEGRAEKGDARFAVEHEGVTYHLASAEQVAAFKKNPAQYVPQCGGWCAFGMSIQDKFPIDPTKFKIVDGKLYVFLNNPQVDALALWNKRDEAELVRKAQAHWQKVSGK